MCERYWPITVHTTRLVLVLAIKVLVQKIIMIRDFAKTGVLLKFLCVVFLSISSVPFMCGRHFFLVQSMLHRVPIGHTSYTVHNQNDHDQQHLVYNQEEDEKCARCGRV